MYTSAGVQHCAVTCHKHGCMGFNWTSVFLHESTCARHVYCHALPMTEVLRVPIRVLLVSCYASHWLQGPYP